MDRTAKVSSRLISSKFSNAVHIIKLNVPLVPLILKAHPSTRLITLDLVLLLHLVAPHSRHRRILSRLAVGLKSKLNMKGQIEAP